MEEEKGGKASEKQLISNTQKAGPRWGSRARTAPRARDRRVGYGCAVGVWMLGWRGAVELAAPREAAGDRTCWSWSRRLRGGGWRWRIIWRPQTRVRRNLALCLRREAGSRVEVMMPTPASPGLGHGDSAPESREQDEERSSRRRERKTHAVSGIHAIQAPRWSNQQGGSK